MNGIEKYNRFYRHEPDAPVVMKEFGYYSLERWAREGCIDDKTDLNALFGYDEAGNFPLGGLGWCEAALCPAFTEEVLETRGEYEVVRDFAGRHVLYFKGRRSGFMPEYIGHPVKDRKTWEEQIKWRLDPSVPERYAATPALLAAAKCARASGKIITQQLVGGYMYLRSLMGPEDLLYKFYDDPELIRDCMQTWLKLADTVIARHQEEVEIDELFLAEDICYNVPSLISHDMIREILFPYYQELFSRVRARQKRKDLYLQVDTDGRIESVIDLYRSIGFNYFSPFEVASGSDVVAIRKKYPDILMSGGFDKRILAQGREAIDREVDRIMPFMKKCGGYIPTCDHGVPEEVSFENYLHFRKRLLEFSE